MLVGAAALLTCVAGAVAGLGLTAHLAPLMKADGRDQPSAAREALAGVPTQPREGEIVRLTDSRPTQPRRPKVVRQEEANRRGEGDDVPVPAPLVKRSAEELRKQLLGVPEVGLNQAAARELYPPVRGERKGREDDGPANVSADHGLRFLQGVAQREGRPDLVALPWRRGTDCQMGKEEAEALHVLSAQLRACLQDSVPAQDVRPDPDRLRSRLEGKTPLSRFPLFPRGVVPGETTVRPNEWKKAAALPTLVQMLQAENTPIRLLLIDRLAQVEGKPGGVALAQRALFDLAPEVRRQAAAQLKARPAQDYRSVLLDGLRYPWPAVANHAAEALAALGDRGAVPALVELLREPDPRLPFLLREDGRSVPAVRELVRLNHLSNCMLCHAPSTSKDDLVRGRVPIPGEDPPPLYYAAQSGTFVRADITYLRQDFSVVQPVTDAGRWPGHQRFDYLVRTRVLTAAELDRIRRSSPERPATGSYEQKEAVLYALRRITGKNPGRTYESWQAVAAAARSGR